MQALASLKTINTETKCIIIACVSHNVNGDLDSTVALLWVKYMKAEFKAAYFYAKLLFT